MLSSHCLWGHIYTPSSNSFHMFAISKHPFAYVCFRKTVLHMFALARYPFAYVSRENIIWHNWLYKELEVSASLTKATSKEAAVQGPHSWWNQAIICQPSKYLFASLLFETLLWIGSNAICVNLAPKITWEPARLPVRSRGSLILVGFKKWLSENGWAGRQRRDFRFLRLETIRRSF